MKYSPIFPEDHSPSDAPQGVYAIYGEGDHEELEHLLLFLKEYIEIPERETTQKGMRRGQLLSHPYLQLGDDEVSLPFVLSKIHDLEDLGFNVIIGFLYPGNPYKKRSRDILTFRA